MAKSTQRQIDRWLRRFNQDFRFGSRFLGSISQFANYRSSNVDILGTFSAKPRLLAPPDFNSVPPKKRKWGSCFFLAISKNASPAPCKAAIQAGAACTTSSDESSALQSAHDSASRERKGALHQRGTSARIGSVPTGPFFFRVVRWR